MREFVIVSGKGGTGKTSLTAAFAQLADKPVLCDADVDAADLHLLLTPEIVERHEFMGGNLAIIDERRCSGCGLCRELCRFAAISPDFKVDAIDCEGCGVCVDLCPEGAISFPQKQSGEWFVSRTAAGPMVHARLGIAEENSGKLVSLIRRQARQLAESEGYQLIITDGPPGIGCPVVAAAGGASALVIIVEPSLSGLHDTERVANLADHFSIPAMICVNRFDINTELSDRLESFARDRNIVVLPRIPFDPAFTRAMVLGKTLLEFVPQSAAAAKIREVWLAIMNTPLHPATRPLSIETSS